MDMDKISNTEQTACLPAGFTNESVNMFFQNTTCTHFPCHGGIGANEFNCMFCYCPLYALGTECGGDYRVTKRGIKDCSPCLRNHKGTASAVWVMEHMPQVLEATKNLMEQ